MAYTANKVINDLEAKTTPVDADSTVIGDSADTNRAKKTTWANIKATLKAYFDTLYTNGTGTANEIAYWVDSDTVGALAVATYPSKTELSYVKGVTSAIQTQITAKAAKGANTDITSLGGLTTALSVAQGGTGATSLDDHFVLLGSGTGAVTPITPSDAGKVLMSNGVSADPTFQTLTALTAIGTFAAKSVGTNYQAATHGFVIASQAAGGAGNRSTSIEGYTDSSATPTTLVAANGTIADSDVAGNVAFIMFPVIKNNYYRVDKIQPGTPGTQTMFFVPLS